MVKLFDFTAYNNQKMFRVNTATLFLKKILEFFCCCSFYCSSAALFQPSAQQLAGAFHTRHVEFFLRKVYRLCKRRKCIYLD